MQEDFNTETTLIGYNNPTTFNNWTFHIDTDVTEPSYYRLMLETLESCSESDTVKILVNTAGGNAYSMISIINAIKNCKAEVTGYLAGEACSAGSAILIACNSWEIAPYTTMMIHTMSYGTGGKESDVNRHTQHMTEWNKSVVSDIYKGFLSEDEIERVLDGVELWLQYDQIIERLQTLSESRASEYFERMLEQAGGEIEKSPFNDMNGDGVFEGQLVVVHTASKKQPLFFGMVSSVTEDLVVVIDDDENEKEVTDSKKILIVAEDF